MSIKYIPDAGDIAPPAFIPPESIQRQSLALSSKNRHVANVLIRSKKSTPKRKSAVAARITDKTEVDVNGDPRFFYTAIEQRKDKNGFIVENDPNGIIFDSSKVGKGGHPSASFADGEDHAELDDVVSILINYQDRKCTIQRSAGAGVELYMITSADYTKDPSLGTLYTVRKVQGYTYNASVIADVNDLIANVSGEGFPYGLVVGMVYEAFTEPSGIVLLKAPLVYTVKMSGGWQLMDSHLGTELKALSSSLIEIYNQAAYTSTLYEGQYFPAQWDKIRGKLLVKIPTM